MLEVQIRTTLPENCALGALNEIMENAVMRVEGLSKIDSNVKGLLRVKAENVQNVLSNLPSYCEGVSLSAKEAKVLIREHTCFVSYPILESGCIITNVEIKDSTLVWNIVCDDESFLSLLSKLEEAEVTFDIIYKGKPNDKSEITYREEEILKVALERGYFDFPKKVKLEELAEYFSIAPSTLSEILRRGQKKVLEKYFKEK
ncbi:helix-turn-helix domain-containing protein [Archaeoglobus neptunius]|uniref:helix-turn-helix domain-containing protein n=1 Tax=Archaeoglobus neptunius TaxID=2798580 RepID=UPI00192866D1|nr:helix-turn-helix domain-containing protein [Archaeoglobus neptunius]